MWYRVNLQVLVSKSVQLCDKYHSHHCSNNIKNEHNENKTTY